MLPLSLLNAAQGKPMLVELKNGETYNGHMIACDNFMNVTLRDVILTSPEGDKFYQMKEVYLKGNVIKYVRVADQILDKVQEDQHRIREQNRHSGGGGGRGGGGGDRGGMRGGRGGGGGGFRGGPNRGGGAPRGGRGGPGRGGAPGGNRGGRGSFNGNGP